MPPCFLSCFGASPEPPKVPGEAGPSKKKELNTENVLPVLELTPFSYQELLEATNTFRDKIGEGGFGEVFKGELKASLQDGSKDPVPVAVKRLSEMSSQGLGEFKAEVYIYSHIRHRNLVKLLGWCLESGRADENVPRRVLLVYELIPNGNLDTLIHDQNKGQGRSWELRMNILKGVGDALSYLHEECDSKVAILHRDIKCNNIMLDHDYTPKLGDFGLSRRVDKGMPYRTNSLQGTRGYIAPELGPLVDVKFTKETDMYSFGVVLLEVATGRRPLELIVGGSRFDGCSQPLIKYVWDLHGQNRLLEAADRRLHHMFNGEEMTRVLLAGLACCHPDPEARLSIREARDVLSGASRCLPCLPSAMPPFLVTDQTLSNSHYATASSSLNVAVK